VARYGPPDDPNNPDNQPTAYINYGDPVITELNTNSSTVFGHANAAAMDVFNQFLVPKMFAAAAKGEMTAEEAVKAAEAQMKPIFDRWREQGKI